MSFSFFSNITSLASTMSLPELSNLDIDRLCAKDPHYGGCYAKDQIPPVKNNTYYIVNLENHTQPGSHWVLLYTMQRKVIYFDPFGVVPPSAILAWSKKTTKSFEYWNKQVQGFNTNTCGYYCMEIARQLNAKVPWDRIRIQYMKSTAQNDADITHRWLPIIARAGIRGGM